MKTMHSFGWVVMATCMGSMMAACGADRQVAQPESDSGMVMAASMSEENLTESVVSSDPNCKQIKKQLWTDRIALMKTPEWQEVAKTAEFRTFIGDVIQIKAFMCDHLKDGAPRNEKCASLIAKAKTDYATLEALDVYQTCELTDAYKAVAADYKDARAQSCFKHDIDFSKPDATQTSVEKPQVPQP